MTQKYKSVTWQDTISKDAYKITGEKSATWYQKILSKFETMSMNDT